MRVVENWLQVSDGSKYKKNNGELDANLKSALIIRGAFF